MLNARATTLLLTTLSLALLGVAAVEALAAAPQLPERMATHFAWDGHADGWMSKRAAFLLIGGVAALVAAPLTFLPFLMRRFPDSMINLPRREYWLAPDRRAESRAYLEAWCAGCAAATSGFMAWTQHLLLLANLSEQPRLPASFGWALGAYLLLTVLGLALLFLRFWRPTGQESLPA